MRVILLVLCTLALAACAGGYTGPPDTSFGTKSHGKT